MKTYSTIITNAYRYVTTKELRNGVVIKCIHEVSQEYSTNHEGRLLRHKNVEAIQLLVISQDIGKLKRNKQYVFV